MKQKHYYGCLKDPEDSKDALYALTFAPRFLPPSADLRSHVSGVGNQGMLGSCTGWAIADGLREHLLVKSGAMEQMSALYVYQHELMMEKTFGRDAGAFIRDGMKVIAKIGCAREIDWPYDITKFGVMPSEAAEAHAPQYRINSYHRLYTLQDIKASLAEGYGCVFGFVVRSSFEKIGSDGKMPMPRFFEKVVGGHAVFVCGYVDDPKWPGGGYLIIKNSWGPEWGDKGYFYMPYAYVTLVNIQDIWTAR